jgi:hypothetical protein
MYMNKQTDITYSEAIYLFADKTISDRSKLFYYDNHPSGEKISAKPLSHKMVTAAIIYLVENEYITITMKDIKKLIFIPAKAVFGKTIKDVGSEVTGIEKILCNNFQKETEVSKAVYHLLDDDESSPWGQVVHISKNSLVEKGILEIEKERANIFALKKYLYADKNISNFSPLYDNVEKKMKEFSTKTDMYKKIEDAVKNGISSRKEQSSSDD